MTPSHTDSSAQRSGVFLLGTDTEVGKTYCGCRLVQACRSAGLRVGVYKPVASGLAVDSPGDPQLLLRASGLEYDVNMVCPQMLDTPVAPPIAAEREGTAVNEDLLVAGAEMWSGKCDYLVVESAGGCLSPISANMTSLDVAAQMQLPVLLIAANRLGVVNHTLLSVAAILERGLTLSAIWLNTISTETTSDDVSIATNKELLNRWLPRIWETGRQSRSAAGSARPHPSLPPAIVDSAEEAMQALGLSVRRER